MITIHWELIYVFWSGALTGVIGIGIPLVLLLGFVVCGALLASALDSQRRK
jgi:hypothetical protein